MPFQKKLKGISAGATGHVDFDIGNKLITLLEVRAGWENSTYAYIDIKKYHTTVADFVVYVDGGPSLPSPASPHASIFVWQGKSEVHGEQGYKVRVSGVNNHTAADVLHAEIVYKEGPIE